VAFPIFQVIRQWFYRMCGENSRKSPGLVLLKQQAAIAEDDNRLNAWM
jgi:hypothetical protein